MPQHINYDENSEFGRMLSQMVKANESADDQMRDVREAIIRMLDGQNGSQSSHFVRVVKLFGIEGYSPTQGDPSTIQLEAAQAMFNELESAYSKTSGNGSVDNVRAARDQFFDKMRGG